MNLLNQLLWKGRNRWQIIGATVGAFLGLFLLLAALQLYLDLQALMQGGNGDGQYVLINKKVNIMNTLGASAKFTDAEIEELEQQPFIQSVGRFSSNLFRVGASSEVLGFYTELFFESVPDEFVDFNVDNFSWESGQQEIPIILSRDYLALYNFGFAPSQGLPQFTPSSIRRVSIDIIVRGNGLRKVYQGRIVGFSDRINSILVPQEFLRWNNERFGERAQEATSRLIVRADNPYASELRDFFADKRYEVSSGKLIGGQLTALLQSVITVIAIIGAIIVLLSVLVFILNFQLIISQAKEDIRLLLQLGYKEGQISQVLNKVLLLLFGGVLLATFAFLLPLRYWFSSWVKQQGLQLGSGLHWGIFLAALAFATFFLLLNRRNIRSSIQQLA